MTRIARLLAILLTLASIFSVGSLTMGASAADPRALETDPLPDGADSEASSSYIPFGLYGDITADVVVDSLSDAPDTLVFLGTSNGLYVVRQDGQLHHFLYSPFGVRFVALVDDVTGDGVREVVVALNDTQVPALRCYDGRTWEKRWQFAPEVRIWDGRWVDVQLGITDLEILEGADSQSIVATAGRCVFSIDAESGDEEWEYRAPHTLEKVAAVADLNGDGAEELFAGSEEGDLHLLDGQTGDLRWRTRLLEYEDQSGHIWKPKVNDILALEGESGKVMVTSRDGFARLFDLNSRSLERESEIFGDQGRSGRLRMSLAPDATGSGPAKILVVEGSDYIQYTTSGCGVALLDPDGTLVWKETLPTWGYHAPRVGSFGGKPVILASTEQQIELIDLADGVSAVNTIPVDNLDKKAAIAAQVDENRYFLVSSLGDMSMVSASGERQWYYPRIDHITTENGDFVGDSTTDTLFCCEWDFSVRDTTYSISPGEGIRIASNRPKALEVRSLWMMDGATRNIAWSYEISPAELMAVGGLKGVRLAPDMVGSDNVPDIIGYRAETIFTFSGKDGSLSSLSVGQTITSIDVLRNGASGWAIAVGVADPSDTAYPHEYGLLTIDSAGTVLWATTYAEWAAGYSYCRGCTVLDDINADNVSDVAMEYTSQVIILSSTGGMAKYELFRTIPADTGWTIDLLQIVPDCDGDGIKEVACLQDGTGGVPELDQTRESLPCPFLSVQSLEDGRSLFRTELQGQVMECDLAGGDFNGDGYTDAILLINLGGCGSSTDRAGGELHLQVISGKDGKLLWTLKHQIVAGGYGWGGIDSNPLPATSIGDADGDGVDDLAVVVDGDFLDWHDYSLSQSTLEIYDVAAGDLADAVPASLTLRRSQMQYRERDETTLLVDIDRDGHPEVIMSAIEPDIPYQPESANPFEEMEQRLSHVLAATDPDSGQHLASFTGFTPATVSVFDTNQVDCLGLAARGCVYFMSLDSGLEVTSPEDGSKTGPGIGLRWNGTSQGEFVQVFVDGVCNYAGNDSEIDLYLARGKHEIAVRSVDDCGRVSYGPPDLSATLNIRVAPSPWKPVLLLLSLFALLAVLLLLLAPRLRRMLRTRKRTAK
jgi:hypothetical protein